MSYSKPLTLGQREIQTAIIVGLEKTNIKSQGVCKTEVRGSVKSGTQKKMYSVKCLEKIRMNKLNIQGAREKNKTSCEK